MEYWQMLVLALLLVAVCIYSDKITVISNETLRGHFLLVYLYIVEAVHVQHFRIIFNTVATVSIGCALNSLWYFDTVGWMSGRTSGPCKPQSKAPQTMMHNTLV